jgi:hypothetical protein
LQGSGSESSLRPGQWQFNNGYATSYRSWPAHGGFGTSHHADGFHATPAVATFIGVDDAGATPSVQGGLRRALLLSFFYAAAVARREQEAMKLFLEKKVEEMKKWMRTVVRHYLSGTRVKVISAVTRLRRTGCGKRR